MKQNIMTSLIYITQLQQDNNLRMVLHLRNKKTSKQLIQYRRIYYLNSKQ